MAMHSSILQPSVLYKGRLYHRPWQLQWRPQHHVVRHNNVVGHERFHSKTPFRARGASRAKLTDGGVSFEPKKGSSTKFLMVTSSVPGITASGARYLS